MARLFAQTYATRTESCHSIGNLTGTADKDHRNIDARELSSYTIFHPYITGQPAQCFV